MQCDQYLEEELSLCHRSGMTAVGDVVAIVERSTEIALESQTSDRGLRN